MQLKEIILKFDNCLKSYSSTDKSFSTFIIDFLDNYETELRNSSGLFDEILDKVLISQEDFINRLTFIIDGVKKSTNYYLFQSSIDGKAYSILRDSLVKSKLLLQLSNNSYKIPPRKGEFYRVRSSKKDENLSQKDLFHIPFNLRGIASTQRYSLPGFTHLYLANSIYTAWKELREPEYISVIRFTNNFPMIFIDLDSASFATRKFDDIEDEPQALVDYAMLFPLLTVCTLKVKNDKHNFKPEYVMPQLLLECIRELSPDIVGVRYRSTRIESLNVKEDNFINFVIPPRKINDKGYCNILQQAFSMTAVEKMDLTEIYEELEYQEHKEIKMLNIKGIPLEFKHSKFAKMESHLESLNLARYNFNS
ncbi:hypothetical protein EMA8858_03126 [Emticicia aquatica]|uniref:RES domain-containing protein n=1 Tax=Emticicia aquatica TaxID=1681835 RepID=A0ABN8EVC0_9BACT|nr:RES domain-containing protein [Emticicia aquatica]CAH0996989.1 hypothetical protein EMA8858_03126 [Emticicia aquatica]